MKFLWGRRSPLRRRPQALLSGETPVQHELAATGHVHASRVAVAACRIYLRSAKQDARNAGFGLWGRP
jgi:hypothetical protein